MVLLLVVLLLLVVAATVGVVGFGVVVDYL